MHPVTANEIRKRPWNYTAIMMQILFSLSLIETAYAQNHADGGPTNMLLGAGAMLLIFGLVFLIYREKTNLGRRVAIMDSELQHTKQQLIHAEKMATLGELTAGIAHEIKNPLNFVTNFSTVSGEMVEELEEQLLLQTNGDTRPEVLTLLSDLKGNMGRIQEHGRRADGIVASMLLHARSQKGMRQETDINALLQEAVQLTWHGMRAQVPDFTVEIQEDYAQSLPRIAVIPQEMSRVFLNVLSNAFQAMRTRILEETDAYAPLLKVSTVMIDGVLEVRILDNGIGIPLSIREKIFQPFFTTKPSGEGTGLGLSLSYDIVVNGHEGDFTVTSEPGHFTEFTLSLPHRSNV